MKKTLFEEKQRFTQWWLWLITLLSLSPIFIAFRDINFSEPLENDIKFGIIIGTIVTLTLIGFLLISHLKTQITEDGIYFKLFPFHSSFQFYSWNEISEWKVGEYKPLSEYGGWGIRGYGDNKAFNVKGNKGLILKLKNGNKRLIGTQQPELMQKAINKIKQQ